MPCPSCGNENDAAAAVCFHCRAVLLAVTRGTVVASRYEVLEPLGQGGMGEVYRARDRVLEEEVALKVLRTEAREGWGRRFRSEIRLARKVTHPNVCRIHDYGEDGALRWISMELVRGENLKQVLARRGPLPAAEVRDIVLQAARGLVAIHEAGIVHRDLSAQNLMLDASGRVRVMDFGIAKPAADSVTEGGAEGYLLGNPEYISPEQARGRAVDATTDVYSLGIVAFELLTGAPPFRGETPVATLMLHLEAEPPLDHPKVPESLRPVLASLLAKGARPSAREVVAALEAIRGEESKPDTKARRQVSPAVLVAGFLMILALVVAWVARPRSSNTVVAPSNSASKPVELPEEAATLQEPSKPTFPKTQPSPRIPLSRPPMARVVEPSPPAPSPTPEPAPVPTTTLAASPSPSPEPIDGNLLVVVTPWADVSIDGVPVGQTPLARLALHPGPHAVLLTHPDYEPFPRRVTIRPGETFRLVVDLPSDGVRRTR